MVTIRDVAKEAGCSISTVSYALNGDNRISTDTRERISKIAGELGYYPMNAARALKSKKNLTVGVFAVGYLSPVFNELFDSITLELGKGGYDTFTTASSKTVTKMIMERAIDGLIVLDAIFNDELIEHTGKIKLPVCFLNQYITGENIITSVQDNEQSLYNIANLLIGKGCGSIAYLSGTVRSFDNRQRYLGYVRACDENNLEQSVINGEFTIRSGYQAIKEMISVGKMYDAIICANDEMCVGALEALKEHGIIAPRDILITGYDDIELSRYYSPHITTVSINRFEWGVNVARRMLNMLNGINIDRAAVVTGKIIERESTKR